MNFEVLLNTEQFLKDETIRAYYEGGVIDSVTALKLYFLGKMRFDHYYETKKTISERLGIPYPTVRRACRSLSLQGFIYQDRCKSSVSNNGKTFYRRLWHFGRPEAPVGNTQPAHNPVENVQDPPEPDPHLSPKAIISGQDLSPKAITSLALKRSLCGSVEPLSDHHTLEEDKLKEDKSIEQDPEPGPETGAIDIIPSSGSGDPDRTFKKEQDELLNRGDIDQYYHHRPAADITDSLNMLSYLKSFRLTPRGKDKTYPTWFCSAFMSILRSFGFEKWKTDYDKDTHIIWGLYQNIDPTWLNRWDLLGLILLYAQKMQNKADNGTIVVQDLWMNTFRKRVEPVLSKSKPKTFHWPETVVSRLRSMGIEDDSRMPHTSVTIA